MQTIKAEGNVTTLLIPPSEFEKPATFWPRDVHDTHIQFQHLSVATDDIKHYQNHHQTQLSPKGSKVSALPERLKRSQMILERRVVELEEELKSMQWDNDSMKQVKSELRNKSQIVEDQAYQIARLKAYICETEQIHRPALTLKMEKEVLGNKLKILQTENQQLSSTLELMDVRSQALNNILSVQEEELGQASSDSRSKQASSLITRWREKVYSLLVQQKTAEILHKKDASNMHQKIDRLENQLANCQTQVQVLQHSLIERSAKLQIEVNEKLGQDLEQTQLGAICLIEQSIQDYNRVISLSEYFERTKKQAENLMRILAEKAEVLKLMSQRVGFASSRIELISTQLIRKSALSMVMSRESVKMAPVTYVGQGVSRSRAGEHEILAFQDMVIKERDSLTAQVRADTEKWSEIFSEAKYQYAADMEALTKKLESVDFQLQQKSKNCVQLAKEIENLKEDTMKKDILIKHLQEKLAVHEQEVETDIAIAKQKLKDEAEWSQRLADLDKKLNNSKREHAKTVVILRHAENSHQRRLQQEQDLLKTTENHLMLQMQQLKSQLRIIEKERNLMLSTLRQEGLLDKLRSDRGKYFQCVDEDGTVGRITIGCSSGGKLVTDNIEDGLLYVTKQISDEAQTENCRNEITSPRSYDEPVNLVLEDLKFLTAAIFENDDEDDNDNN